jgi:hypothetical protein
LEISEFSKTNIRYNKLIENTHSSYVLLDQSGYIYFRRYVNEINPFGRNWQKLNVEKQEKKLNRVIDFDIGPKDLITINANGRIKLFYDINRPRLYDV